MEWHDCTSYAILFFEEMYVRDCLKGHKWLVLLTIKEVSW